MNPAPNDPIDIQQLEWDDQRGSGLFYALGVAAIVERPAIWR